MHKWSAPVSVTVTLKHFYCFSMRDIGVLCQFLLVYTFKLVLQITNCVYVKPSWKFVWQAGYTWKVYKVPNKIVSTLMYL